MQHFSNLLQIENSELSRLLRFGLYGLEASLKKARAELSQDPGTSMCDEVLSELHRLLEPSSAKVREQSKSTALRPNKESSLEDVLEPILVPTNVSNTTSTSEIKFKRLQEVFNSDKQLRPYLGNFRLESQTDSDLWNEIQRKLLRIPEDLATSWRERALDLAQEVGAKEDKSNLVQVPFIRDEVIYPGLTGTVLAQGLCLSKQAPLDPQISQGNLNEDLHLLAGLISTYMKIMEIEPDLHHALKSVFSFNAISLHSKPEQRHQYINALIDRFRRTQQAQGSLDSLLILRAWIDLDEAIHSLVFVPPPDRYSWWGKLQQESRRILKKVADRVNNTGYQVRIRLLSGLYADVYPLSKDDLQLDCGGNPGEVLACLRVYAKINQEELPGRVIFRSAR
ncbi:hypothetical protein ACE1CI_01470 [Aerosakkonemataceae cyanobacterium BLCC-F50]|uniref:Uncharacterized protein n=1 Tax=Floridaenema flaviceps BLCC-F50 TaxID=3153642 RepID=A0ABV4XIP8_9CYAN